MVSVVLFGIYIALLCYQLYKYCFYRPPNFPPGPPRIPLVGSYLFLLLLDQKNIHKAVLRLCKWYKTKHLGFFIGNTPTIVTNDQEGVREILFSQAYDGRPDLFISRMRDPHGHENRGIFFTEGPQWKEQRRFTLRHLRDYGFGRRFDSLEREIHDELLTFINMVKEGPKYPHEAKFFGKDNTILCPLALFPCLGNTFLQVLFGERLSREEQAGLFDAAEMGLLFQRTGDDYGLMLSVIPWIRYLFPGLCGYNDFKKCDDMLHKFMRGLVDRYIETHNINLERNFIDLYIVEMNKAETAEERGFIYDQLILTCMDFFFPSLTAIGQQIVFLIQFALRDPEIKFKIQKEIEYVVGSGRLPGLDDRINMNYTEACIRECLRLETLVPSSIPHKALHTTKFLDYDVPKGAFMVTSLYAFHNDEKLWGDPMQFRPERFLDMRGQLSLKKDVSLPFGAGKRLCAGETFARNGLFLMTAALFQNFDFELPDGMDIETLIEKNQTGIIRTSQDFTLKLIPR